MWYGIRDVERKEMKTRKILTDTAFSKSVKPRMRQYHDKTAYVTKSALCFAPRSAGRPILVWTHNLTVFKGQQNFIDSHIQPFSHENTYVT